MSEVSQAHLLTRIHHQLHGGIILHYDRRARDLCPWFWPVTRLGTRVAPSELSSYRDEHDFRMPCCLCVIGATDENSYMECAIYLATSGPYSGEYVAGCTSGRCAYLMCMERMYTSRGLLLRKYPVRPLEAPLPPAYDRSSRSSSTALIQLLRLDSWARPGLPEGDFRKLLAKCRCGLVMTRRVFEYHLCTVAAVSPVIIDLTSDTSDDIIDLTGDSDDE